MNTTSSQKFQILLNERQHRFPSEGSNNSFTAVANSAEGAELLSHMKRAGEGELVNSDVPVQSPRHAALLGRIWPIPDAEFRRLWLAKFGPLSDGQKTPTYPSEEETRRRTAAAAGGSFQGDAKLKEEGRRGFLDEVARLMAEGRNRDQAWAEASSTSPGKEFYGQWSRGKAQVQSGA